jgi:4-amino-4-deoxy-L-arabinose transferase-like glycosyltransferase
LIDRIEQWLAARLNWIVLMSLLLGFALRLQSAAGTFLNPDEALHFVLVNQNTLGEAYRASLTNAHPPLFFVLLYFWRFIGSSEVMLRLPSVLASTAAAWMAFRWILMVLGRAAGFTSLLLLTFSPVLIALGAEVRNYSVLLLWMASSLYFLERGLREQKLSSVVYYSLFLYLAILTHYSALWFVIAAGIYALLRMPSTTRNMRTAWALSQLGAAGIYAWLYIVHISKLHNSPIEAEAVTGWLRALYFRPGENPLAFLQRQNLDLFQFLFGSRWGGDAALALFIAGVLWLLFKKQRDCAILAAFLLLPFILGMGASLLGLYPYGGTRHCVYLILFATAGVSFITATITRQRLLPVLLLAILILPYWNLHRLPDPQQMGRKEQRKDLMASAIADLRASVPPSEPLFADYQASIELAYYLGRDHPPAAPRECGGVMEVQYGAYSHVIILGGWSATAAQATAGIDGWRKGCNVEHVEPRDSVWIFDAGWGLNLLDDLSTSAAPGSISQAQKFGETISLFKLKIGR